jgi:hypothetical protein
MAAIYGFGAELCGAGSLLFAEKYLPNHRGGGYYHNTDHNYFEVRFQVEAELIEYKLLEVMAGKQHAENPQ